MPLSRELFRFANFYWVDRLSGSTETLLSINTSHDRPIGVDPDRGTVAEYPGGELLSSEDSCAESVARPQLQGARLGLIGCVG